LRKRFYFREKNAHGEQDCRESVTMKDKIVTVVIFCDRPEPVILRSEKDKVTLLFFDHPPAGNF
jgi:hypothetical protein